MQRSFFCSARPVCAALAICLLSPAIATANDCGSLDRLAIALRFAQALYPELRGMELGVSLSHGSGGFIASPTQADGLQLRLDYKDRWHPPDETVDHYYAAQMEAIRNSGLELPLTLYFSFIEMRQPVMPRRLACRPVELRSDVGEKQMRDVANAIEPHPEWSDAQELEQARKLGLHYGPEDKDAVLQLVPLKELSRLYGPLKIKSAQFFMNGGQKCAGCSFVLPRWEVKVSATHDVRWLSITIEPFFGRITNLSSGE
jgi:hypothetical protein